MSVQTQGEESQTHIFGISRTKLQLSPDIFVRSTYKNKNKAGSKAGNIPRARCGITSSNAKLIAGNPTRE